MGEAGTMIVRRGEELRRRRGKTARALLALTCVAGLVAGGCATAPATQPVIRIGVVDPQKVLNETEAGKKARESLSTFMKNRQALIELEEKELRRMEEDLIKQASVLSANAKKEREELFRRRMAEYQQKANELNREVQEKLKEVLEGFRDRVEKVVAKVAQRLGLVVVIEKGRGGPTIYHDSSLDISAMVIEEFNKGAQ
jgi:outer membrane protein